MIGHSARKAPFPARRILFGTEYRFFSEKSARSRFALAESSEDHPGHRRLCPLSTVAIRDESFIL